MLSFTKGPEALSVAVRIEYTDIQRNESLLNVLDNNIVRCILLMHLRGETTSNRA